MRVTRVLNSHRLHLPRGIFFWDDIPVQAPFPIAYAGAPPVVRFAPRTRDSRTGPTLNSTSVSARSTSNTISRDDALLFAQAFVVDPDTQGICVPNTTMKTEVGLVRAALTAQGRRFNGLGGNASHIRNALSGTQKRGQ